MAVYIRKIDPILRGDLQSVVFRDIVGDEDNLEHIAELIGHIIGKDRYLPPLNEKDELEVSKYIRNRHEYTPL